jgi:hypothetical protein
VLYALSSPKIVQTSVVRFPVNGDVVVQACEEIGKFPLIVFISKKTGRILYRNSIEDKDKWLLWQKNDALSHPDLRFGIINSSGFKTAVIMSVGIMHGGSDDAFFLTTFGEIKGKILRLNLKPMFANIQGGYYLGHLNKKYGYGLAVWNFVWGHGPDESHYSAHHYEIELYRLQGDRLVRILHKITKRMYDTDKNADSLHELGIFAKDQRKQIPYIKDFVGGYLD